VGCVADVASSVMISGSSVVRGENLFLCSL